MERGFAQKSRRGFANLSPALNKANSGRPGPRAHGSIEICGSIPDLKTFFGLISRPIAKAARGGVGYRDLAGRSMMTRKVILRLVLASAAIWHSRGSPWGIKETKVMKFAVDNVRSDVVPDSGHWIIEEIRLRPPA
jgi:hypothetical protein